MYSLSARLLVLTILVVMMSEVFIFVPSLARFRLDWMNTRVNAAHLTMLALDVAPDRGVGEMLRAELLSQVGAHAVLAHRGGARLVLSGDTPPMVAETFRIADQNAWDLIVDALAVYMETENRVIRIMSPAPADTAVLIELVLDEAPMRGDMIAFSWRILGLSVVISLLTASGVYLALLWLMVRPMGRITANMVAFREDPEDAGRIMPTSRRRDEIGAAERELADMQHKLRAALTQKAHLAALGGAVAKINHDLRGILSTALLVSDRLESSEDPEVRRITPTLVNAIERAAALCSQTLDYAGHDGAAFKPTRFALRPLVEEIRDGLGSDRSGDLVVDTEIDERFELFGDRDQIFRILNNLMHNAAEAGAGHIAVAARTADGIAEVEIRDDGPGLPPRARDNLFRAFEGSARAGGTGLGLAIARELARAHGGDLTLVATGPDGTIFHLELPANRTGHDSVTRPVKGSGR